MTTWDGKEHRRVNGEHKELLDRLGNIDVKVGIVETKIDGLVLTNMSVKDDLSKHETMDRWIDMFFLSILVAILMKLFH